jgi:hypothetical protein
MEQGITRTGHPDLDPQVSDRWFKAFREDRNCRRIAKSQETAAFFYMAQCCTINCGRIDLEELRLCTQSWWDDRRFDEILGYFLHAHVELGGETTWIEEQDGQYYVGPWRKRQSRQYSKEAAAERQRRKRARDREKRLTTQEETRRQEEIPKKPAIREQPSRESQPMAVGQAVTRNVTHINGIEKKEEYPPTPLFENVAAEKTQAESPFEDQNLKDKYECLEHFISIFPRIRNEAQLVVVWDNQIWGKPAPDRKMTAREILFSGIPDKHYYFSIVVPGIERHKLSQDWADDEGKWITEAIEFLVGNPRKGTVGRIWTAHPKPSRQYLADVAAERQDQEFVSPISIEEFHEKVKAPPKPMFPPDWPPAKVFEFIKKGCPADFDAEYDSRAVS